MVAVAAGSSRADSTVEIAAGDTTVKNNAKEKSDSNYDKEINDCEPILPVNDFESKINEESLGNESHHEDHESNLTNDSVNDHKVFNDIGFLKFPIVDTLRVELVRRGSQR